MNRPLFHPASPDAAGVVSWVHFGDLHMESAESQNYRDLVDLVQKVNKDFAKAISFVLLPGDNADKGSAEQYELVRSALDEMRAPWCAIVGDHDVHEKSFENFLRYLEPVTHYAFKVGALHFFALNAFSTPDPKSFDLSLAQLDWLRAQLDEMPKEAHAVLFLHCYPSDLKEGSDSLREIGRDPRVRLIDMGHTHYNEVANDGNTLYTATRSTGQIEEGPVGFSVTNVDSDVVSWKFLPLTESALVMITSPADDRFRTASNEAMAKDGHLTIRAKVWGCADQSQISATIADQTLLLNRIGGSDVYQGLLTERLPAGFHEVTVTATGLRGERITDSIGIRVGDRKNVHVRAERDQDNAIEAWPERGLLGTQLGPNKNGRKW